MIEKEILKEIFKLKFIDHLSIRNISSTLNIHRNSAKKYIDVIEKNLNSLRSALVAEGKCSSNDFDKFLQTNWELYIDKIISFTSTRRKRVLNDDVINAITLIAQELNTTSATVIFDFINENLEDTILYELSYSSIWRALKMKGKNEKQ